MSAKSSIPISLLAWAVFLTFGSGNTQFHSSEVETPSASATPTPQIAAAPTNFHLDGLAILEQAHSNCERSEWLACDIRQKKGHGESPWSSEGTLQRGPKGCCRLEQSIRMGVANQGRMIVVSDGRTLARVFSTGGPKPKIESWPMPDDLPTQNAVLANQGSGGPATVFAQVRARGSEWSAQPATLGDRPGLAITGSLAAVPTEEISPKNVRLFLDAETLWLARAEWWSDHPDRGGVRLYEVEFLNPRVNQPLSLDECGRVFSYRAES